MRSLIFVLSLSFLISFLHASNSSAAEPIQRCLKPSRELPFAYFPRELCIDSVELLGGSAGVRSMTMVTNKVKLTTNQIVPLTNQEYTIVEFVYSKSRKMRIRMGIVPEFNRATRTWSIGNWNKVRLDLVYPADTRSCFMGAGCEQTLSYK